MAATALEASKAVNALLNFSSNDQEALLEVLQDYFSSPAGLEEDGISDEDDEVCPGDDDSQATSGGKVMCNKKT